MKKLFWIAFIVFAGWCAATEDGKKFTIKLTSAVGLTPPLIEMDFDKLDGGIKKDSLKAMYPQLNYFCYQEDRATAFGDNTCNSDIALFNGMKSYNVALFFKGDELSVIRVAMQPESYEDSVKWLDARYTRTDIKSENSFTGGKKHPITLWKTPSGNYVLASQDQTTIGETILLWTDSFYGIKP